MDKGTLGVAAGIALVVGAASGRLFAPSPPSVDRPEPPASVAGVDVDQARRIADEVASEKVDGLDRRVAALEAELGSANADGHELVARIERLESAESAKPTPEAAPPAPSLTLDQRVEEEARRLTAELVGAHAAMTSDEIREAHAQSRVIARRQVELFAALDSRAQELAAEDTSGLPVELVRRAYRRAAETVADQLRSAAGAGADAFNMDLLLRASAARALARARVDQALE